MKRLTSKVAIITGGTQSIGKAIAALFYEQGAKVIISGRQPYAEGKKIAESIGQDVAYVKLNVIQEKDWQAASQFITEQYGKLDVIINNAGIEVPEDSTSLQNPEDCSLEDWQTVHKVNVDGIFLGCKYAISLMKHNQNCSIVNIGSRSALVGVPSSAAYSSSKAAIRNYTKTVALYCAANDYSIRCNVIHPAAILTKMWDKELGNDDKRETRIAKFSENIPLKRMGRPLDVAYAALFLASDESQFITGTELLIDGGLMAGSAAAAQASLIEVT